VFAHLLTTVVCLYCCLSLQQAQQAGATSAAAGASHSQQQQQQQQHAQQPPLPQHSRARSGSFRVAIAKFDYTAHGPEQISFKANDVIKLHSDKVNGKGWGLGEVNGKMGWFPGDFVKIQVLLSNTLA
jgi:Variant SH3 domain